MTFQFLYLFVIYARRVMKDEYRGEEIYQIDAVDKF